MYQPRLLRIPLRFPRHLLPLFSQHWPQRLYLHMRSVIPPQSPLKFQLSLVLLLRYFPHRIQQIAQHMSPALVLQNCQEAIQARHITTINIMCTEDRTSIHSRQLRHMLETIPPRALQRYQMVMQDRQVTTMLTTLLAASRCLPYHLHHQVVPDHPHRDQPIHLGVAVEQLDTITLHITTGGIIKMTIITAQIVIAVPHPDRQKFLGAARVHLTTTMHIISLR